MNEKRHEILNGNTLVIFVDLLLVYFGTNEYKLTYDEGS